MSFNSDGSMNMDSARRLSSVARDLLSTRLFDAGLLLDVNGEGGYVVRRRFSMTDFEVKQKVNVVHDYCMNLSTRYVLYYCIY